MLVESGTYANTSGLSGTWLGLVTSNTPNDNMNVIQTRYIGNLTRNVGRFDDGPQDFTGTLNYKLQDMRLFAYALGSCVDAGSPSPYTHVISEVNSASGNAFTSGTINPFMSFTMEDSKVGYGSGTNFIRTYKGVVIDNWTLKGSQGGLLDVSADWIAQSCSFSSGAVTPMVENGSMVPYKWSHITIGIPSGTLFPETKSFDFAIKNNFDASNKHYLNGSRVIATPSPQDRVYMFNVDMDLDSARAQSLYQTYFIGGSTFNAIIGATVSAGSQDFAIIMSGCKLVDMQEPTVTSKVQDMSLKIVPQTVNCNVDDFSQLYNPF